MSKFRVSGNKSSILVYPTAKPELNLDFVNNPEGIDPAYSFTRNSAATYVGPDGYIKTAGVNQPRVEYDPVTGECKGLLVEESRTNYARPSEPTAASAANNFLGSGFGYNVWYRYDSTVTSKNRLGINGLNVIPNSTIDFNGYTGGAGKEWAGLAGGFNASISTGPGSIFSFYINPNNWNGPIYCGLLPTGNTTFITRTSNSLIFNNGVYVGSSRWTVHNIFNDGTYRISKTILNSYNDGTYIVLGGSAFCTFTDIVGDESSSWWVGGVQYEISQPTASSYIPTTSSAVTRQPDQLLINKPINLNGTFFIESSISNLKNQQTLFNANDGTNSFVLKNSNGEVKQETTNYISKNYSTTDINSTKRIISYQNSKNIFMSSSNIEDSVDAKTSGNLPFTPDRISIGYDNLNADRLLNGYIKKFSYYPKALTDNECRALVNDKNLVIYSSYKNPIIQQGSEIYHIDQNNFSYWVHEFKTIGSTNITINEELDIEYLIVAGGGGGGADIAGGGGGGQVLSGSIRLTPNTYSIVVGGGGNGATFGNDGGSGNSSTAFGITAAGGEGGKKNQGNGGNSGSGNVGGSGGGLGSETFSGGGGAGDSANGGNSVPNDINGRGAYGGAGTESLINGTSIRYGGGGGGSYLVYKFVNLTSANLGLGVDGGGRGGVVSRNGTFFTPSSGSSNRGGGGGGGNWSGTGNPNGASGGSGIVIIRYKV